MGITIVVGAIKGGIGKTTVSHLLIEGLRKRNYKVLAIDLDQQCNLSSNYKSNSSLSAVDMLKGQSAELCISNDFIQGHIDLAMVESQMRKIGAEFVLAEALTSIKDKYDFIVIDTPPASNMVNINAYVSADYVVIPCNADYYNLQSVDDALGLVESVNKYYRGHIQATRILLNRFKDKGAFLTTMKNQLVEIAKNHGSKIMNTFIRDNQDISVAVAIGSNVFDYKPASNGAKDFDMFVDELLSDIVPSYQPNILKGASEEVFNYIENMRLSQLVHELGQIYVNSKPLTASEIINTLDTYKPMAIKVVLLWGTQYKRAFQSINYYKKILENTDAANKDAYELYKELNKIGE